MKVFRGRINSDVYVVELDNESYITRLSLVKSLQVVDHSPEGFELGHSGSGCSQLSAAILYEVTGDADMARQYYQIFLSDYVKGWGCSFEINEFQVNRWLQSVGADMVEMGISEILDGAKTQFKRFHHFYERARRVSATEEEEEQGIEVIALCESAILLSCDWIQEYRRYILELEPAEYGTTPEGYKWKPMLEGIRDQLPLFIDLLYDQQPDHWLLEKSEDVKREVMELLARHIYISVF